MMIRTVEERGFDPVPTIEDFLGFDDSDGAGGKNQQSRPKTKKDQILDLYKSGVTVVEQIAERLTTRPSYVANVLQDAGLLAGYFDLYTTTYRDQNAHSRFFRGVLAFKTVEAARESVARIDGLYKHFEKIGDRAGQHHAEVLALTGRNRARWSGKPEAAAVFMEWLVNH